MIDIQLRFFGLVAQPGHAPQPALDERHVDVLQPLPVDGLGPGHLEPVEQADGSQVHKS
jgi:hypothetical protein